MTPVLIANPDKDSLLNVQSNANTLLITKLPNLHSDSMGVFYTLVMPDLKAALVFVWSGGWH